MQYGEWCTATILERRWLKGKDECGGRENERSIDGRDGGEVVEMGQARLQARALAMNCLQSWVFALMDWKANPITRRAGRSRREQGFD